MTDYSKMSDFEINRLVARAIDGLHGDDRTACDCYLEAGVGSAVKIPDGDIGWFIMDYCNNPADAWPIIVENKITIMAASVGDKWMAQAFNYSIADIGTRPLRSAMIVFLMMKDAEKC